MTKSGLLLRVPRTRSQDGRTRFEAVDVVDCTDQEISAGLAGMPNDVLVRWVVALASVARRALTKGVQREQVERQQAGGGAVSTGPAHRHRSA